MTQTSTPVLLEIFKKLDSYIQSTDNSTVLNYTSPEEMKIKLLDVIDFNGKSIEELFPYIDFYLNHAVNTGHPQFFNQLFSGRNLPGIIGELLGAITNTSMYTYEMAPVSSLLEKVFLEKFNSYIGYTNPDGSFTTGGSNANLLAMLCARQEKFPEIKHQGLFGSKPLVAFVSSESHYSFLKAANAMGIGMDNIIKVETNDNYEMNPIALDEAIQEAKKSGKEPFFIGATAGTTVWGSYDPIRDISNVAKKHNLWFHVDGAFGGSALLSRTQRKRLDGLELSDSFTWDAHKMMGIPLICSIIMVNNRPSMLTHVADSDDGGYLFHGGDESLNLGKKSFQCGRRVDILKLWLSWSHFGDKGYESRIDHCVNLSEVASDIVQNHPRLSLIAPQQFVSTCFQYVPTDSSIDINAFNQQLRIELFQKGLSMVNQAKSSGKTFIRLITVNPDISSHDIQQFFDNVISCATDLENTFKA